MPIFRKDDTTVLFIHVPKAGGTSIENLFIKSGWEVALLDRARKGTFNPNRRCSPQHMDAVSLRSRLRLETFDLIFMTVREPLSRFRSELVMRNRTLTEPWNETAAQWADSAVKKYHQDPYTFDNHLRPQHEFYLPAAHVFRLEAGLEQAVATLRGEHGLNLEPEPPHAVSRHGSMPGSAVQLPTDLRTRLLDMYREDYVRFGYSESIT